MTAEALVTVAQLARHFGVSERTIRNWRNKGMPHYTAGTAAALRFRVSEVEAWMRGTTTVENGSTERAA